MGLLKGGTRRWTWLVLAGLAGGCDSHDADRLARIGRITASRGEELTRSMRDRLARGWEAIQAGPPAPLESRVSARLRWDRTLAGTEILISTSGPGAVVLRGSVPNDERRQRALDLAKSTEGVERVVDELSVPPAAAP